MDMLPVIALIISLASVLFTGWAAFSTWHQALSVRAQTQIQREQVEAAKEQTQLQAQIARDNSQPYVWADIQPDMKQGTILDLVIGNIGPTLATDVRVTFDGPLPVSDAASDDISSLQRTLAEGLHSLAPGREIRWHLGLSPDLLAEDVPQHVLIRVDARGPHGQLPTLEVPVDVSQWRQSKDAPDGSLHRLKIELEKQTESLQMQAKASSEISTSLRDLGEALDELHSPHPRLSRRTSAAPRWARRREN